MLDQTLLVLIMGLLGLMELHNLAPLYAKGPLGMKQCDAIYETVQFFRLGRTYYFYPYHQLRVYILYTRIFLLRIPEIPWKWFGLDY